MINYDYHGNWYFIIYFPSGTDFKFKSVMQNRLSTPKIVINANIYPNTDIRNLAIQFHEG